MSRASRSSPAFPSASIRKTASRFWARTATANPPWRNCWRASWKPWAASSCAPASWWWAISPSTSRKNSTSRSRPIETLSRLRPKLTIEQVRGQLGGFGFSADKALTKVGQLSGGERARLMLALATLDKPNLLILDEPTNHLDIDARNELLNALNDFDGAVVLVSHDRRLIEATADRLLLVADGKVAPFEGDLDDYRRFLLSGDNAPTRRAEPEAKPTKELRAARRGRTAPGTEAAQGTHRSRRIADRRPAGRTGQAGQEPCPIPCCSPAIPPRAAPFPRSAPKRRANWPPRKACGWRRRKNMKGRWRRTEASQCIRLAIQHWLIAHQSVLGIVKSVLASSAETLCGARMSDSRFFQADGPFALGHIAEN